MTTAQAALGSQTVAVAGGRSHHPGRPSQFAETCEELATLLSQRREDPAFWGPLTELLRVIIQGAVGSRQCGGQPLPQARLLAAWDVDELAHRLREALPRDLPAEASTQQAQTSPQAPSFVAGASPGLLAAFLLLGFAVAGCSSNESGPTLGSLAKGGAGGSAAAQSNGEEATGGAGGATTNASSSTGGASPAGSSTGGAGPASSGTGGNVGSDASANPLPADCSAESGLALRQAIDESSLSADAKQVLYDCLVDLKASWCDGLTELFATSTPEQTAAVLEELATCCSDRNTTAMEYDDAVQQRILEGMLCPVPIYKGVSFPT